MTNPGKRNPGRRTKAGEPNPHVGRHPADDLLAAALARGMTAEQAAQEANLSSRTVSRRLKDPAFLARVRQVRSEILGATVGFYVASSSKAALVLHDLLEDSDSRVRLAAANSIQSWACKGIEQMDLAAELAELRAELEALKGNGTGDTSAGSGPDAAGGGGPAPAAPAPEGPGEGAGSCSDLHPPERP